MLKSERKQIILSQLKQDGFVTLENLTVLLVIRLSRQFVVTWMS